ncbi:ATP-dependent helicase [Kosmotoga sp.]|uniref:ATP-dependent helicase n=1 Tax=Kosmotoga sp. TaxID=1955248 RepID=UPI0024AB74F0|nr:ATP-dependent helicase [Kosmotoga sp.]MDI3524510.1 ATP-dependent helicase UvrD/PcrA [Kosmotoga sp.]
MKRYNLKPHGIPNFIQESLDNEQLNAVLNSKGRTLIVAGPGSGKTRVITFKIAYLVSSGVNPQNILLVTFTRAASREMIERARRVSGSDLRGMLAGTFHHVCNHFLRKYATHLGISSDFTILDREDSKDLIKHCKAQLMEQRGNDGSLKLPSPGVIQSIFSYSVNCMVSLDESIAKHNRKFFAVRDELEEIWKSYTQLKLEHNTLDYDDLLIKAVELFENNPEILIRESSRFQWILVDEFQDTNLVQYKLVEMLAGVHGNLIVVGDDAQSIYSFRGARFENVYDFLNRDQTSVFKIQTNYRSTPEIVRLVNHLVPKSSLEKQLKAVRPSGPVPVIVETWDNLEEASFVAQKINEHIEDGIQPNRIAVLYRSHFHSMELQLELDRRRVPYIVFSGPKFVETAHVKDILAFLKILQNPYDQLSWGRVLRLFPGVGIRRATQIINAIRESLGNDNEVISALRPFATPRVRIERLISLLEELNSEQSPEEVISTIYKGFYGEYMDEHFSDAKERRMDIERLIEVADRYDSIGEFLEDLAVSEKVDIEREIVDREEKIVLSTVHQAKGLEWDVVFILAMNPGDFPHALAIMEGNLDEEERIFYVAVTRARDYLYLIRQRTGRSRPMIENSYVFRSGHDFLTKIPEDVAERWDVGWNI